MIPKTTQNQQIAPHLIKPIPEKQSLARGQKMDSSDNRPSLSKSDLIKYELNQWIDGTYQPTHFLTVRLPENQRNKQQHHAINHLQEIMTVFEKSLLKRHWNKKHLPFIAFAENDVLDGWHFHILLNQSEFTEQDLYNAIFATNIQKGLPAYSLNLLPIIDNVICVESYSTKQIKIDDYGHFDSDRIILSHDLFNLPYQTMVHSSNI